MPIVLVSQLNKQLIDTHANLKFFEDTVDRALDSCIRVLSQVLVFDDHVACRNSQMQLSARSFLLRAAQHAFFDGMQFVNRHRALNAEQQTVLWRSRIEHLSQIADQSTIHCAPVCQLTEVHVVSGQSRDIHCEHDADFPIANLLQQQSECFTLSRLTGGYTHIAINDQYAVLVPSEFRGSFLKPLLYEIALSIVPHLPLAALANIDHSQQLQMSFQDLFTHGLFSGVSVCSIRV